MQGLRQREPCIGMGKQDCRQVHMGVPTMVGLGDVSLGVPQMRKSQAIPKSNNKFKDKEDRRPEGDQSDTWSDSDGGQVREKKTQGSAVRKSRHQHQAGWKRAVNQPLKPVGRKGNSRGE